MDACSLRQDQQLGRARWWRSRLRSETGRSEQGRYILRHSAVGGLTGARSVWRKISRKSGAMTCASSVRLLFGYGAYSPKRFPPGKTRRLPWRLMTVDFMKTPPNGPSFDGTAFSAMARFRGGAIRRPSMQHSGLVLRL